MDLLEKIIEDCNLQSPQKFNLTRYDKLSQTIEMIPIRGDFLPQVITYFGHDKGQFLVDVLSIKKTTEHGSGYAINCKKRITLKDKHFDPSLPQLLELKDASKNNI